MTPMPQPISSTVAPGPLLASIRAYAHANARIDEQVRAYHVEEHPGGHVGAVGVICVSIAPRVARVDRGGVVVAAAAVHP